MPRYFFHLLEDGELIKDREGLILRDDVDAHIFAMISARGITAEMARTGLPAPTGVIQIVDDQNRPVGRVGYHQGNGLD